MSASNKEIYLLVERMTDALTEISMGQSRHVVIEAAVHAAAALVTGCVGPKAAPDALTACATIFTARAEEARKFGTAAKTSSSQSD